jgi:hypothetical protein
MVGLGLKLCIYWKIILPFLKKSYKYSNQLGEERFISEKGLSIFACALYHTEGRAPPWEAHPPELSLSLFLSLSLSCLTSLSLSSLLSPSLLSLSLWPY